MEPFNGGGADIIRASRNESKGAGSRGTLKPSWNYRNTPAKNTIAV